MPNGTKFCPTRLSLWMSEKRRKEEEGNWPTLLAKSRSESFWNSHQPQPHPAALTASSIHCYLLPSHLCVFWMDGCFFPSSLHLFSVAQFSSSISNLPHFSGPIPNFPLHPNSSGFVPHSSLLFSPIPKRLHPFSTLQQHFLSSSIHSVKHSPPPPMKGKGRLSGPVKASTAVASWFAISSTQCANICTGLKWPHSTNSTYQLPSNSSQICIIVFFIYGAVLVPSFRSPRHGHFRFINRARSHK